MKFRKKPVVIEAWPTADLLRAAASEWKALPSAIAEAYERGEVVFTPGVLYIKTLEGEMSAEKTDYVIKGVKGELYPCKPDIFDATYEAVP